VSNLQAAVAHGDASSSVLRRLAALGVVPSGVTDDSRQVRRGDLFLAYPGDLADGRRYIAEAISHGAAAVLWEENPVAGGEFSWHSGWQIANLPINGLRTFCGPLAHAIYGRPSERLSLVAVTGTNGKTSVTQWIGSTHPRRCPIIGTLGAGLPGQLLETGFTTPEATTLMRFLADFADQEAQACALEASSIGIAEGRLDGARVDVAVFTNLTRDHLDYHSSMEQYAQAKARLFTWPRLRLAISNLDDPCGRALAALSTATKVIGYTQQDLPADRQATIRAEEVEETIDGLRFRLCAPSGRALVETGLLGRYNVSNLLAVAAVSARRRPDAGGGCRALCGPDAAGRSPGKDRRSQRAAGGGRLCAHSRCPGERLAGLAAGGERARSGSDCGVRLWWRSRSRQKAVDG
jgi:UDP-N-acetylmuramyl-tripeptide synthetase